MSPIGPVKTRPHQLKWLLLVGVTLLAAFFRLHRINSLPPGDGYDPAFYGLDALAILQGELSIRDVIPFPKTQTGSDPMTQSPTTVDDFQLIELGIGLRPEVRAALVEEEDE